MAQRQTGGRVLIQALVNLASSQSPDEALDCAAAALGLFAVDHAWLAVLALQEGTFVRHSEGGDAPLALTVVYELLERVRQTDAVWLIVPARDIAPGGWRSQAGRVYVAPVRPGGELAGVLALGLPPGRRIGAAQRGRIVLLAQQLGAVLGHLRLRQELQEQSRQLLATQAQLEAYAHDMRVTYEAERERYRQLRRAYEDLIRILATAIEERDDYTGGHIKRVAAYAVAIGRELGLRDSELQALEMGAILHDVGKIGIADAILRKRGGLAPAEWAKMREHPLIGARMLEPIPFLRPALDAIIAHHERVDGRGYPRGLAGEAIPLVGRIVAVADAFDAMTTDRPYRRALSYADALLELRRQGGRQLDRDLVAAFERVYRHGKLDGAPTDTVQRSVSSPIAGS